MSRDQQIEELFHRLLELPAGDRAAAASGLAGGDADLAGEALRLAAAHERAEVVNRTAFPANPGLDRRFGAYRTMRLLGSGGMGAVYLAERADGQFEHHVAIKVMGQHVGGAGFERRFQEERQILAGLVHPNIARLLDGNVSESGEPYLVLEYVDGIPLDAWCQRQGADTAARLQLFGKVCSAVEFAHRNLVVHLDLKPSNILVTPDGEPKLLDFGAARLLSAARPKGVTLPMLTLRYASPEQIQSQPPTTLSDVYSLGVILYELLTGQSPFRNPDSWEANFERAAGDVTIQPPANLEGELATVIRKALTREPERRYASVREFADDLQRYLDGHPILARPSTFGYRTRKFLRRHRYSVGAATLVGAAVIAGTASTLWQARKAQRRFDEVRQLVRFVMTDLNTGLQRIPGTTALQRQSVERSLEYLDRLSREAGSAAGLRVELAEGYRSLGDVLGNPFRANLGDRKQAEAAYQRGLAALQRLSPSLAVRREAAKLRLQLAGTRSFGGDAPELNRVREAVAELKKIADEPGAGEVEIRLDAARGLEFLGVRVTAGGGNIEGAAAGEAKRLFDEASAEARAALAQVPRHAGALRMLAQIDNSRAILHGSTEPVKALEFHKSALEWLSRLEPADAAGLDTRRLRAKILLNTGWAEGQARHYDASIAHVTEAGAILDAWAAADPENTNALYQSSGVYRTLGIVNGYRGDGAHAVEAYARAAAIHRRLSERDPSNKVYRFLRGEVLLRSGNWLVKLGRTEDARAAAGEGMTALVTLADAPSPSLSHVFGACRWLTETEVRTLRDPKRAAEFCRKAIERTKSTDPDAFMGLAEALHQMGDRAGAVDAARKAIASLPAEAPGQAKSQQRAGMEAALQRFRGR